MTTVLIPDPSAAPDCQSVQSGELTGDTVGEVHRQPGRTRYPGIGERLLDQNGDIKRFINVFVNDDEIRTLQGADTPVSRQRPRSASSRPWPAGAEAGEPHDPTEP